MTYNDKVYSYKPQGQSSKWILCSGIGCVPLWRFCELVFLTSQFREVSCMPLLVAFFISFHQQHPRKVYLTSSGIMLVQLGFYSHISFLDSGLLPPSFNFQKLLGFAKLIHIIHAYVNLSIYVLFLSRLIRNLSFPLQCNSICAGSRIEKLEICKSKDVLYSAYHMVSN